jgi:hypothetical protein
VASLQIWFPEGQLGIAVGAEAGHEEAGGVAIVAAQG